MADFVRITQSMAEQQFDALLVAGHAELRLFGRVQLARARGSMSRRGLAPWMTCLIPPDRSFTFGSRFRDTDLPVDSLGPDHTRAARLTALADEMRQRGLARARIGLDMDFAAVSDLERLKRTAAGSHVCLRRSLACRRAGAQDATGDSSGYAKQLPPPNLDTEKCCGRCVWAYHVSRPRDGMGESQCLITVPCPSIRLRCRGCCPTPVPARGISRVQR